MASATAAVSILPEDIAVREGVARQVSLLASRLSSIEATAAEQMMSLALCLLESTDDAVFVKDREGRYVALNHACAHGLGHPVEAVLGRDDRDLVDAATAARLRLEDTEVLRAGRSATFEATIVSGGVRRTWQSTKVPLHGRDGAVLGLFGVARDVTENRAMRAALLQKERLALIGELSATVAHEVRNPVATILNCVQLLERDGHEDRPALLGMVREECERLSELVTTLLEYARPRETVVEPLSLVTLVTDALRSAACRAARDGVSSADVHVDLAVDAGVVLRVDRRSFHRALANVFGNAIDAMGGSGRLTVAARRFESHVELTVSDTGAGVPEAVRERIFEPFFTTRAQGTGLGLALARRIVEDHGGTLTLAAPEDGRTTFRVMLPL